MFFYQGWFRCNVQEYQIHLNLSCLFCGLSHSRIRITKNPMNMSSWQEEFTSLWNYWHATFYTLFIYFIKTQRIWLTATSRWGSVSRACHKQYTFVHSGLAREWKKETGWHNPLYRAKCQDAYEERTQLLPMTPSEEPFCLLLHLTEVKSSGESSFWGNPLETTRGINKSKSRELKKTTR